MVDIFDEVNEELRAERTKNLLMRYGGLIIAICVAIVAATAGWQAWRWWQARQDVAAATQFIAAMSQAESASPAATGDKSAIAAQFESLAASAPEGYRTLSLLRAAALRAQQGDTPAALALWDQIAADQTADPLLRDLASLLWAEHQLQQGDPALLEARLKPLTAPDNPWRPMARELLALVDLRQGRTDAAKTTFRALADDVTTPAGVRARSSAMLGRMGG
ncbi:MAG: tetratricopeptide repeat protein [Acetobacteraceae bacterium]